MKAPRELEAYYRQAELWELSRYEDSPLQRLRARVIAAVIGPETDSVLDVGCGNGFVTRRFPGRRVVGLDPSEEALTQFDGEKVVGSADRSPFADRSFDVVVCTEVLEHLSPGVFEGAVAELDRVAKSQLVIGVPNDQDLRPGMTRCPGCGRGYHVDLHRRRFRGRDDILRLFPAWQLDSCALLGEQARIRSELFRRLRHCMAGFEAQSSFARCPWCGAAGGAPGERRLRRFFDAVASRLAVEVLPNWIILSLRRRPQGTHGRP